MQTRFRRSVSVSRALGTVLANVANAWGVHKHPEQEELMIAIRDAREANPGMGTKALAELFRRERGWQVDNVRAVLR